MPVRHFLITAWKFHDYTVSGQKTKRVYGYAA